MDLNWCQILLIMMAYPVGFFIGLGLSVIIKKIIDKITSNR